MEFLKAKALQVVEYEKSNETVGVVQDGSIYYILLPRLERPLIKFLYTPDQPS